MTSPDDRRSAEALAIGVEIGGRGQRVVLATRRGRILDSAHAIGYGPNAAATVETICNQIDSVLSRQQDRVSTTITGIGVAFGGPVDASRGVTLRSHRVSGFEQFPLVGVLEERFSIRTVLENDARAAAVGEFMLGAGRGAHNMVYLHLGTGVGGAIIFDGKLQHGASMTSGEIGHMVVISSGDGPRCSCGKPGHLEAYASVPAIVERMRMRLASAPAATKAKWLASPGVTVERIFHLRDSDPDAQAVVDETIQVVGLAAANLVTALNPDAMIVGGEVALSYPAIAAEIRSKIRQYAFDAAARQVKVTVSQLGADAGLIGAVALAQSRR